MSSSQGSKVQRFCKACNKEFFITSREFERGRGIYCSKECHYGDNTKVKKICRVCQKEFFIKSCKNKLGQGLFCSLSCKISPKGRFESFVTKTNETDCWGWSGGLTRGGYGKFTVSYKTILAHRFSYELHFGPIPELLLVCHKCDCPPCTNPSHLFLGTAKDNTQDMLNKNRHWVPKGQLRTNAKLTNEQVIEMRKEFDSHQIERKDLAAKYDISLSVLYRIAKREIWSHI